MFPCIYTNPQDRATHEHCYSLQVYRIDEGKCGEVPLAGLKFALVIRSGRVMSEGGRAFACVVGDAADAADAAQYKTLAAIEGNAYPRFRPRPGGRRQQRALRTLQLVELEWAPWRCHRSLIADALAAHRNPSGGNP